MEPVSWGIVVLVVACLGTGFGAGWGLKPDASVKALEAQTEAIAELNAGNEALIDKVTAVALTEAEKEANIADKLTNVPPQCIPDLGGDPMSAECQWAWCVRTGETDKQRCEASKLTDMIIQKYACPEVP